MTAVLVTTICIAFGQEAECRREVRIYDKPEQCLEMKRPMREYLDALEQPRGAKVVFVGVDCVWSRGA